MTVPFTTSVKETELTVILDAVQAPPTVHHDPLESAATSAAQVAAPSSTQVTQVAAPSSAQVAQVAAAPRRAGDPRALLIARLLAAAALMLSAFIHGKLALDLGIGGPLVGQGQLFAAQAALSSGLAVTMLSHDNRVWLAAVVLSVVGLGLLLASVYFPIPAVGPFPEINEPVWLMTMTVAAFAQAAVPTLWLIRQIAPPD